ncbi:Nucleus export protein BRR6 [Choanephora cucurbitarum]|uniref:Nucleus export protein BRR6 n=1 Tax=Choanephora cucurbitarum TaxID=101091 RepID=A0A1C7MX55_9FUNG|nr:Nucleus export protein BRR6 [Choanephora cucurbitarum]
MDDPCSDPMDFEYTNLGSFFGHTKANNNFEVPASFFDEGKSKKSLTNTVCNLLDNFSLSEKQQEQKKQEETLLSEIAPKSPTQATLSGTFETNNALVPIQQASVQTTPSPPQTMQFSCPVEQTNIPPSYSPTFIINAPPQTLISSSEHQKGTIVYLTGLFKLALLSITFSSVMYIAFQVVCFISHDMKVKTASFESGVLADQLYCQHQYDINRCAPHTRLPAVQHLCREWEQCMYRPMDVSKSQILAETLASMLNTFVNTLSLKSLV